MKAPEIRTLHTLYKSDRPLTTTEIAKEVFEDEEIQNADRKIRYYLTENLEHLVDVEDLDGSKHFALQDDVVFFGDGRVEVLTQLAGERVLGGTIDDGEDFEEVSIPLGPTMVFEKETGDFGVATLELSEGE